MNPPNSIALACIRRGHLHARSASPRGQAGVGLIEVLVAVLILSIGFLGIGALLAMSMSTNNSAMARSMATISSYSIMDAMRADIDQAKALKYNGIVKAGSCPAASGSSPTLADAQRAQWCNQLGRNLGSTNATKGDIECDGSGECTVTITFDDSRAGNGGTSDQTVVTKGML